MLTERETWDHLLLVFAEAHAEFVTEGYGPWCRMWEEISVLLDHLDPGVVTDREEGGATECRGLPGNGHRPRPPRPIRKEVAS